MIKNFGGILEKREEKSMVLLSFLAKYGRITRLFEKL